MRSPETFLRDGLSALGLDVSDEQVNQLLAYQQLILKWNKVYNLTAVRDPHGMLTHHLLDSLAAVSPLMREVKLIQQTTVQLDNELVNRPIRVLDVGSGAGLPGVVMAICCPCLKVDCVDAVGKKAAFIQQVAAALGLPNLTGIHARVENLSKPYEVICSRAFASLIDFTTLSDSALSTNGVWLAMKGKHPIDELSVLPPTVHVFHVEPLIVPGLGAERCLVWMRRATRMI